MWHKYPMSEHCQEYDYLTIEEKLLVDIETRRWFASANSQDLCVSLIIFREIESRIIKELKEKDGRRKNDKRNRESGASGTDSK